MPSLDGRKESVALADTDTTTIGQAVAPLVAAHPGKTGVYLLPLGSDSFAARMLLVEAAERTLDLQYYIWHGDQTGYLLLEQVWRAAQRGVRVRILLDDMNAAGLDETIATLSAQPNIEVRLYNPLVYRTVRALNFLTDFSRIDRRMHNKSFTADNQVAIVGGRNVGNEYFGAGTQFAFQDLDVLAVGAAVREVSGAFDLYWNSPSAFPALRVVNEAGADSAARLEAKFAAARTDPEALDDLQLVRETPLLRQLLAGELPLEWAHATVVRDNPAKTLDRQGRGDFLMLGDLVGISGFPRTSFDLISSYFIPGNDGAAALATFVEQGVKVRVLTNSLASSDDAFAYAGYAKWRCDLVRAGVKLYEFKPRADDHDADKEAKAERGASSSSSTSLHAKTFATDGTYLFVGSFNFDPRSSRLNTEMGLMIESPTLAQRLSQSFDVEVPEAAYEVRQGQHGHCVEWIEQTPAGEVRYTGEPRTGASQRVLIDFLSVLPIDWLL